MPNKNVLNWPSLSTVDINVYPDTLFVADADNNRGYITTIFPNQTKKLWGDEVSDYEANRIAGYPNPKGIYVNEDGEVVNPKFNTNAIIYNPLHVNGDGVLLDALHVMHDSPIYLELFNLYVESIPLGFSPLMDAANDEFGRRGMTIVDKYQRGLPLTKEELEIIEPIYDALLRRLFAPDYMRNIEGGYLDKAELPIIPSIGMSGDLAIKNYLESYPLLEVTVTPNNHADGGPLDWNELSMKDKAAYIRMGVANGYKDIDSIKKVYKEFKKGGPTKEEVFLNSLELSLVKNSRYNTPEWRKFLTDLAFKESSFHPDSLNSIGAKGYFQLMPANRSEVWSYPTQLFEEMYKLTDANILYLRRNMTLEDLNRAEELGIDLYGLIAGAHLGGAKNALKALRGLSNAKDSNNTSVLDYMTKFSQVNSGNFTNIEGRVTPVISPTTVPTIEPAFNKALLREELFHTELPDALRIAPIINNSSRKPEVVIPKPIIVSENNDQTTISGNTLPEVTVTAKAPIDNTQLPLDPLRYFIPQYSLDKPLLQFVSYEPVSTDTAIDRLTQLNNNRNTLLQQDLEDTILRNTLLGTINLDLLRKDVEDLQFYRNMAMNPLVQVNSFEDGGEKEKEDGPGFWVRSGLAFSKLIGLDKKYKGEGNRLYAENLYNLVDPTAPYPRGFWDALTFKQIADKAMENKSFPLHRTGHEPLADAAWAKRLGLPYDESYLIDNGDGTYRLNPTYEAEIPTDISFLENRIKANQELLKRYEEKGMDSFDRRQAINKGIQVDTEALKALKETFATGKGKSLNQDANTSRKWIDGGAVQYSVSPLSALLNFTIRYNKDNNTLEYSDIYDFNHFEDFVPGKPFTIKGSIKLGDRKADGGPLVEDSDAKDTPDAILKKYEGTRHDLNKNANTFTNGDFRSFINRENLSEDTDVAKYFKSYVNSDGFERIRQNQNDWWAKRHPLRSIFPDFVFYNDSSERLKHNVNEYADDVKVFPLDMYAMQSFYSPKTRNAYVGRLNYDGSYFTETLGHEYAHGVQGFIPYQGIQNEVLNQNTNTNLSDHEPINRHDSDNSEKHSDIWGLKYLLYKEGIYDSRSKNDVTPAQIKKLREKYPDIRPLRQMDDDKTAWMLNHVAYEPNSIDNQYKPDILAFGGNLFDGFTQPTQQMDKTYDVGFLPEVTVTAPKRWFVGYDDNANPIYTTEYTQSQEYLQNQLPVGNTEQNRRRWAFENVGSNGQVRSGLHGDAADLAKAAQLGIGTALTPLAAEPLVEASMPFMEVMARPSTTATRIGSKLFPSWSKALPYTEMMDRGLMGYLGTKGMYNTGKDWYNGEIPWYQAVPQMGLSGLMMADAAPVIRTARKGMDNIERRAIEVAMRSGAGADGLENSLYGIQKLRKSTEGRERLKRIGKYILTGKREGVDGTYNSLAVMRDSRVHGGVEVYGGVGDAKPYDANRKDLVDAFLYRDEIDPSFGLVKVAQGGDFGPHARFIAENYADKASSIPVYEVNTAGAVPEAEVISNGEWQGIPSGTFMSNEGAYVNVAGHLRTTGTAGGGTVRKGQDIWKFLGKDYWPKWLDYKNYNPLKKAIIKLGLHEVNRLGTPVITRTKWAPDYEFNTRDILIRPDDSLFKDEKLTELFKARDWEAFFDRVAKIPEDFKAYGGHIYGGLTENNLKMQIGNKYWETLPILPTFDALLAEFIKLKEEQERIKAELLKLLIEDKRRQIAERRADNLLITSNDAIYNPTVSDNSHLMDKAIEGAKAHAAWELEHPNLTSWGTILGATPFAVASVPALTTIGSGITTLGDAAAATSVGQGITNLLTPIATTSYAGATVPQWVDLGLTSGFGAHGIQTAIDEGGISPMTALELAPMLQTAKPMWNVGKDIISDLRTLYNNYPIKNYNLDSVLKSDFYELVSKLYGKDFADELANKITSPEYRQFLFGNNPREAIKAADKHLRLMQFVKDVENAGGMLGGSGQLARNGSVVRDGLMHDVDFFVPGSMEERTSPVFDALGYSSSANPSKNNMVLFGTGYSTPKRPLIIMGGIDKGYINLPKERYGMSADMFIRPDFPSNSTEAVQKILDAKRQFKRPDKDLIDLANYKPYSADNPMIDLATGEGQWNPTLFDNGILTSEGYPVIQSVETYPGSGVRVPAMMNYKGQIRTVGLPIALEANNSIIRTVQDNGKIRLSLPTHTAEKPRQFVLEPAGDNKFYVHMRTWDGDHIPANLSSEDKQTLFNALYDELPDGAEILFPKSGPGNYATRGTVAGLQRLARDPRFIPGTKGTLLYLDKDGKVKTYEGTSFVKAPQITAENAEPAAKKLHSHLLGEDAVKMFKEYGGTTIPEGSINGEQLRKYVPEVRERYGLVGNENITDEEIAQALYKHTIELGGNTAAVNAQGEPQLLFRGSTRRNTELHPKGLGEQSISGADNILGNLFLGELPGTRSDIGVERYLGIIRDSKSGTVVVPPDTKAAAFTPKFAPEIKEYLPQSEITYSPEEEGLQFLYSYEHPLNGTTKVYKVPAEDMEFGANDINGFVVRTPKVRNSTEEIVIMSPLSSIPENKLLGATPQEHYKQLIKEAEQNGEGLLKSEPVFLTVEENINFMHPELGKRKVVRPKFRDEHSDYTYFALPNFNIRNAKHIIPYDLRIPRDWSDSNIYRTMTPIIGLGTLGTMYGTDAMNTKQ